MISRSLYARKTRKHVWSRRWVNKAEAIGHAVDALFAMLKDEVGHMDPDDLPHKGRKAALHVIESLGEIRARIPQIVRDLEILAG